MVCVAMVGAVAKDKTKTKAKTEAAKVEKPAKNRNFTTAKNLETFSAIYKQLDQMYVDTLDADVTVGAGIKSMLRSLDPYTEYYPADETKDLRQMLTGKYAGIGATVRKDLKADCVIIDEPYEGMPAALAGLKKGDCIISIDDSVMTDKTVSYVSEHLRGEAGSTFLLKVIRPTGEKGKSKKEKGKIAGAELKFKITRKAIQLPAVPYYGLLATPDTIGGQQTTDNKIGYIYLSQFTEDCSRDVRRALVDMRSQGMTGLIFDLRDNGGGSLQEAIKIVNMFVPKGETIVTTKGKLKQSNHAYKTESEPLDTVMPTVVLVNGNTASASEITAGSLQDFDRAVVMGTRTYGKGLVQQMTDLPHDGSLKLTTSKYYIPSGRCIQAINYKHTGGGYKEHIPDSLTHEFTTRGGRLVRDGGGIKPDVEVKGDSVPNIAMYLTHGGLDSTEVAHYYIVDYIQKHPTIAPANEFKLSDADYQEFKDRVLKSGFKYDRETSKEYDTLVKWAKFEGYFDDAKPEFEALKAKLEHNLAKELDNNQKIIRELLEQQIITAYYYQKGAIECTLNKDSEVKEAVKLLNDPKRYRELLETKK